MNIFDEDFTKLISTKAELKKAVSGFQFTEGPVWLKDKGVLLFSDIPAGIIYQYKPGDESAFVYRQPSGNSNGLTTDKTGRLICCEHGTRTVTRQKADGSFETIASEYLGKKLNSPNDACFFKDGSLYFTDPPYGITPDKQEQPHNGLYRLYPDGRLELMADDFDRPNGLAFSPDFKTLYVADSSNLKHIRKFDVSLTGQISNSRVFADMKSDLPGVPDGMKVDRRGNIWATGPGGVWVFSPSGKLLGQILTPEVTTNCAWGGPDGKTLFITAGKSVYSIMTTVGGR